MTLIFNSIYIWRAISGGAGGLLIPVSASQRSLLLGSGTGYAARIEPGSDVDADVGSGMIYVKFGEESVEKEINHFFFFSRSTSATLRARVDGEISD